MKKKKIPMRYAPDRRQVAFRAGVWSCCGTSYGNPVEAIKHLVARHQLPIAQAETRVQKLREAAE